MPGGLGGRGIAPLDLARRAAPRGAGAQRGRALVSIYTAHGPCYHPAANRGLRPGKAGAYRGAVSVSEACHRGFAEKELRRLSSEV